MDACILHACARGALGYKSTCSPSRRRARLPWQGPEVMRVGNDAEMAVPGEAQRAVVRIQALWSERPQDGRERMLTRTRRYYRCGSRRCCRCCSWELVQVRAGRAA